MNGRWRIERRGTPRVGKPWLVLRGSEHEAVLWNGAVLELAGARPKNLGPDILAASPDYDTMLAGLRSGAQGREIGDALLDQRLVAGIGNLWRAEALWEARVSPWRRLDELADEDLRTVLEAAHRTMRTALDGKRPARRVYRRVGRPCPRCGAAVRSAPQGDHARTAYWCPECQR
jgi:endonuclease-8